MTDREPLIPEPGPIPRVVTEYLLTYRDQTGATYLATADDSNRTSLVRKLAEAGYDVAVQRRQIEYGAYQLIETVYGQEQTA
ncbi:hypothetical protein [Nocardia niwae]|uniref:hypothetical protein n=1 Tax=Nocardia niwae TaxID=626084 RepID=UPI0007A38A37|nr:hypothetical protein [Nocardia niwae]